ncbi:MAG: alpha-amylase [Lachnospiraceae bacterium]|nr:alpha-amylase [Lachnospiraceae bacterium]
MNRRVLRSVAAICGGALLLSGCGSSVYPMVSGREAAAPDRFADGFFGTTYEIFVGSFADSDGDGIGDLNGIRENLDYLNDGDPSGRDDLGVNALWLTPVFPSPTYHKYDATDYRSIDPTFGTLADFDSLVKACHARGIRVLLDLAVNHTSKDHPWFREAAEALRACEQESAGSADESQSLLAAAAEKCPRIRWYHFSDSPQTGYERLPGTNWFYEARFWSGMPDLNLDEAAVRDEIEGTVGFWLDRGVDGFRLDAVTSYYTDEHERSEEFLAWFADAVHRKKKDAYLVGEAWEGQESYAQLYRSGVDSFFDFAFAGQEGVIAQTVRGGKNGRRFAERMEQEEALYASYRDTFINAPFYTNHDMARSAGYYAQDGENRVKLAMALNLLQSGNAFVYYGEELGMKGSGRDENKRAPFPWTGEDEKGKAAEALLQTVCRGPEDMEQFDASPFGSLAKQKKDRFSVYNYCREAIHLRARHPLIAEGRTKVVPEDSDFGKELTGHPSVCGFTRVRPGSDGEEPVLILVNTGAERQTITPDPNDVDGWILLDSLTVGKERVKLVDALVLPGYAVAVVR